MAWALVMGDGPDSFIGIGLTIWMTIRLTLTLRTSAGLKWTFPPLADPFKRRFGLVVARFRMVHRDIQCRITDVLDVQFRVTEVLDVIFTNLYVLNRNALVKKNA
jgi:hypothetical protein